jgi:hypothetical protein
VLQPQTPVPTENVYGIYINRVEAGDIAIDLLPGWWNDAERSVLQPQSTVTGRTKNEDGVRITDHGESGYVAVDLLSGWWNTAEGSDLPPQIPAGANHENFPTAIRLEWACVKEAPEHFLFQ